METERTINFTSNQTGLNIRELLLYVKTSLEEKGYNYTNQISGYLITGDPSYIPRYNNSRNLIKSIERDLIIEELLRSYLEDDE
ncbi:MAG: IreB family regulatory phosphoprotein [Mycoplasmatales bacterium]